MRARWFFWAALAFWSVVLIGCLTACGGTDHDAPPPSDHWLLVMQTTDHQLVPVDVYESANDCTAAGSYRVFSQPAKFSGYECKEV